MRRKTSVTVVMIAMVSAILMAAFIPDNSSAHAEMVVYKSPTCGCCTDWVSIVNGAGYKTDARNVDDVQPYKEVAGVPMDMTSCHTAFMEGYFIEGHVPLDALEQLLTERPAIDGIVVPGMPAGSPGMSGEANGPLEIYAVTNGEASLWMLI